MTTFSRTCYEFQTSKGGSFETASDYCRARGGLLLHGTRDLTHHFIASELERRKEALKSKLVWLGAQRDQGLRARTWHFVDGKFCLCEIQETSNRFTTSESVIRITLD